MNILAQRLVPGLVGISTFVDFAYQKEMQLAAVAAAGTSGPINQLRSVTVTLDFNRLIANLRAGRRDEAEEQVAVAAKAVEAAGSDFIVVTSGTTSTLTGRARERVSIPFIDIAAACWKQDRPRSPVGLLSTRAAAAGGIFQAAAQDHGAEIMLPSADRAGRLDQVIFDELVRGIVSDNGIAGLCEAVGELAEQGARSIILGNTDMTLAATALRSKSTLPLIDAAMAHARDAAHIALRGVL